MVSDDDAMRAANREEFEREMYDPDRQITPAAIVGKAYVAPVGTPLNKPEAWTNLGNTTAVTHNMAGVTDVRAWNGDIQRLNRGLRSFTATLSVTMRESKDSLLKVFAPEAWARLQHQRRYHRVEDPAVSVMHAAYDRRRRARRRRNRR